MLKEISRDVLLSVDLNDWKKIQAVADAHSLLFEIVVRKALAERDQSAECGECLRFVDESDYDTYAVCAVCGEQVCADCQDDHEYNCNFTRWL